MRCSGLLNRYYWDGIYRHRTVFSVLHLSRPSNRSTWGQWLLSKVVLQGRLAKKRISNASMADFFKREPAVSRVWLFLEVALLYCYWLLV